MIYFNKNDDKVIKYNVNFDKEQLKELREDIINNCSKVTPYDYISTIIPSSGYNFELRNFEKKKIGVKDNNYCDVVDEVIYHFKYDKYEYPYLIEIIDGLLLDNAKYIDKLFNPVKEKELSFKDQSVRLLNEINSDSIAREDKLLKLKELEILVREQRANINIAPIYPYYVKVLASLYFEEVKTLDNFDDICDFFESSKSIEEVYDKVVELIYNKQVRDAINQKVLKKQ